MPFHRWHVCDPLQISTKEPSLSIVECNGVYLFHARELSRRSPGPRREKVEAGGGCPPSQLPSRVLSSLQDTHTEATEPHHVVTFWTF